MRLQKFIAHAGICSRRKAEELIKAGRVWVDGVLITELGVSIDPENNEVSVDGKRISFKPSKEYMLLHKPPGVLSTVSDPFGRRTIMDLVREVGKRVYPVGRLDQDSEGLMLLTNDGELTNRLLHPRHKIPKKYHVTVQGHPSKRDIELLKKGVEIEGRRTQPCHVRLIGKTKITSHYEVILKEGRKRQIRLMFKSIGHPVSRLIRTAIGPLTLDGLPRGKWRRLTEEEVKLLKKTAGL